MREVEFRGKRYTDNKWVYGYYYKWHRGFQTIHSIMDKDEHTYEIDQETLCEYIGILDYTNTKMFEKDVVTSTYDTTSLRRGLGEKTVENMIIKEDKCNPCFVLISVLNENRVEYDFIQCGLRKNLVIGNIFDNPELLNG